MVKHKLEGAQSTDCEIKLESKNVFSSFFRQIEFNFG